LVKTSGVARPADALPSTASCAPGGQRSLRGQSIPGHGQAAVPLRNKLVIKPTDTPGPRHSSRPAQAIYVPARHIYLA